MKSILTCPLNSISTRMASHRSSQGVMYASMIADSGVDIEVNWGGDILDLSPYDSIYVYHGNDWSGGLNIFGGVKGFGGLDTLVSFSKFKGKVYSIAIDFPPYHEMIKDRLSKAESKGSEVQPGWYDIDLDNLERMFNTSTTLKFPNITDKLVIGDSHSICMYRPGWTVNSVPFKTLNGALKEFTGFIEAVAPISTFNYLECYFGNIDIRHHVCRLDGNPIDNTRDLARRYLKTVEELPIENVSIYELLPIEDESRKIPSTGHHKGKPFWGSWDQRNECRLAFRDELESRPSRVKIIRWTDYLLEGDKLSFDYMEKPRSVHLSRQFYQHWDGSNMHPRVVNNSLEDFFG